MTGVRVAMAGLAMALAAAVAAAIATNAVRPVDPLDSALTVLVGWSFAVSGGVAWQLRPDGRIGPAMIVTSVLWSVAALYRSQDPLLFTIGHLFQAAYLGGIMYVLLVFPSGRLVGVPARTLAFLALVLTVAIEPTYVFLGGHMHTTCDGCPDVVVPVLDAGWLAEPLMTAQQVVGALAAAAMVALLAQRWRAATPAMRFAIMPVMWSGVAATAVIAAWAADMALGGRWNAVLGPAMDVALAAVAVSFLIGVARTGLARTAVADLLIELSGTLVPGALRAALARALHDPSLAIAYWLPGQDRFVDAAGDEVALPSRKEGRSVTMIERDGRRIAAFIHDPAVDDEHLMRSASAAAALALENERLQAELRAQLTEVRASRARIVEATQSERRRIERDLHDGTQQRLVSIAMTLGLAEVKAASDGAAARELIAESRAAMTATLAELRELSRGIHPGILTERGLPQALEDLVMRLRMPVELDLELEERLPPRIETAAYYVVSEGLTNVAKHAGVSTARVRVARANGAALVEISDDGAGGADPAKGSGLRGLRDRVEAVGGRLDVTSAGGRGTTIRAELPCG